MSTGIRVLYVDDDPRSAKVHGGVLADDGGLHVTTASSPSDGFDLLATRQFDCVLSDLHMPEMDGIEFLSELRTDYPRLPFLLFTSEESEATIVEAFDRGATDLVPKSFCEISSELLIQRIILAVEASSPQRETEP